MRRGFPAILLICLIGLSSQGQAIIEGRVGLPKTHSAPVAIKRYEITSKGGVLAPSPPVAIVYLEGSFPKPATAPITNIIQQDLMFIPALLPVQTGTKVEFPNLDNCYHNIFSYSPAKRFDLGRYRSDERPIPSQVFDAPGLITLRCDIHEHMRGLILVLETPHFTMTDPDGHFRLSGLPTGQFKLKAWVSSKTTFDRPVELTTNSTQQINLP